MTKAERDQVKEMLEAFADNAIQSGIRFWGLPLGELTDKEKLGALAYCAAANLQRNLEHGRAMLRLLREED